MRTTLAQAGILLLAVTLVVVLVPINRDLAIRANLAEEFLPLWVAARTVLIEGQSAYDTASVTGVYEQTFGTQVGSVVSAESLRYTRPLPALLPVAPAALLPYATARAMWLTFVQLTQPILFLVAISISGLSRRLRSMVVVLLFGLLWRYGLEVMISGHIVAVEALLAAVALLLFVRGRTQLAGPLIGIGVLMGGLLVPLGLLLLVTELRSRRWLYGLTALGIMLGIVVGLRALFGGWVIPWLASVVLAARTQGVTTPIVALGSAWVWVPLSIGMLFFLLWHWIRLLGRPEASGSQRAWVGCLTLTISFALLGPMHLGGALLLVPAMLLIAKSLVGRWGSAGVSISAALGIILLAIPWASLLLDVPLDPAGSWLYWLPITATLIGLWWIRWWVVRGSRLTLSQDAQSWSER